GRTLRPFVKGTAGGASTLELVAGYSTAGLADPDSVNVTDLEWDIPRPDFDALVVRWARGRFTRGSGSRWGALDIGHITDLGTAQSIADGLLALADARSATFAVLDPRSEEHTSELQSRENLVCRRLLDKNKHSE